MVECLLFPPFSVALPYHKDLGLYEAEAMKVDWGELGSHLDDTQTITDLLITRDAMGPYGTKVFT